VLDGDTIEVMHDGMAERIRLASIDCPEKNKISEARLSSSRVIWSTTK
jgi:endonuclease YncB( thermonuclease family)